MKKTSANILMVAILLGFFTSVSPSVAATMSCKQVNEVKTIKFKEFVCTKSAGKLVWKSSRTGIPEISLIDFMPIPDGFSISLENYDDKYGVSVSVATGDSSVDETGIISVTGNLLPKDSLKVKVSKGKYFRVASYSGEGFDLKSLEAPSFAPTLTLDEDGFKLLITNYDDDQKYWDVTSSRGSAMVTSDGYLWVSDLDGPGRVEVNFNLSGDGFKSLKSDWSYVMPEVAPAPILDPFSSITSYSMDSAILNYDNTNQWKVRSSAGVVTLSNAGVIRVSGLNPNQSITVYVTSSSKDGYGATSKVSGKTLPIFSNISERDWALIAKNPNGNIGKTIIVYGKITQFNSGTGLNNFRADVNGVNTRTSYGFNGENSFLTGTAELLKSFVADDYFYAKVIVSGTYSYTSIFNGNFTVPKLEIVEINRL